MQLTTLITSAYLSGTNPPSWELNVCFSFLGPRLCSLWMMPLPNEISQKKYNTLFTHYIWKKKVTAGRLLGVLAVWPERFLQAKLREGDLGVEVFEGLIGDRGVWILAPSLTVSLAARSAVHHMLWNRQGRVGRESGKRKIGTTERENQGRDEDENFFSEEERISRPGARFGRGDVCFPRGTTTFHQHTAKMLWGCLFCSLASNTFQSRQEGIVLISKNSLDTTPPAASGDIRP